MIDRLITSGLFDARYYASRSGAGGTPAELVAHYLSVGEAASIAPSEEFDAAFYRRLYPDAERSGESMLVHYLTRGLPERRYPNPRRLRRDVETIESGGVFDHVYFALHHTVPPGLSDIEYYLSIPGPKPNPSSEFDEQFYFDTYEDARQYSPSALIHFIEIGRSEGRVWNAAELRYRTALIGRRFNVSYYLRQCREPLDPIDALDHYVKHGQRLKLDPSPDFSADYYARRYPDLRPVRNYYMHYLQNGINENRVGRAKLSDCIIPGERAFRIGVPTVMVALHGTAKNKSALVNAIVRHLAANYNVLVALGSIGPLHDDFRKHACAALIGAPIRVEAEYYLQDVRRAYGLDAVLLNSIENVPWAGAAFTLGIPSVALLHEAAEYGLPTGTITQLIEAADRVIAPHSLIRDSIDLQLAHYSGRANHVVVHSEHASRRDGGRGPSDGRDRELLELIGLGGIAGAKVVLGAGGLKKRDGIDLFIQTAREVQRRVHGELRFVWAAEDLDPKDAGNSIWVAELVHRMRLEDTVFILPDESFLERLFRVADVLYLPSRLDTLPDIALEALRADKAVVCFDHAAENVRQFASGTARGAAVAYGDLGRAADAVAAALGEGASTSNGAPASARAGSGGDPSFINEQFALAKQSRRGIDAMTDRVMASGLFDAEFHDGDSQGRFVPARARESALLYVARAVKGFAPFSPRPGFHEAAFQSAMPPGTPRVPGLLLAASAAASTGAAPATHRCTGLDDVTAAGEFTGRILIHIHLFYAELAPEFARRLSSARCEADLFITTTSPSKRAEIEDAFRDYELGAVRVVEVVNRGRDVGALVVDVRRHVDLAAYDVIGHFHGKRSLAIPDGIGDRWRNFLLDTLVADRETVRAILSMFENEAKLGLVFAEDRHCVAWTKNKSYADSLAERLALRIDVPAAPIFPIGTMFWARPQALASLWETQFESEDFPEEPLAYDGILPGAIEMMIPTICEAAGYEWNTVYRRGQSW